MGRTNTESWTNDLAHLPALQSNKLLPPPPVLLPFLTLSSACYKLLTNGGLGAAIDNVTTFVNGGLAECVSQHALSCVCARRRVTE